MSFSIKKESGYPALYENGEKKAPLIYHLARGGPEHPYAQKCIPQFHSVGIDVVGLIYELRFDWMREGFNGRFLLEKIAKVKQANPDAKILLRLKLCPPHWWMRENRGELIEYYQVETRDLEYMISPTVSTDYLNDMRVSFVSKKWWQDTDKILKEMYHVLVEHGYGQDIFSIQPAYGTYGEWHIFGKYDGKEDELFEGDYSQPMLDFFRSYLKEKYGTDEMLQKAWKNNKATLATAELATPQQRKIYQEQNELLYRLPEENMQALDTFKCLQLAATTAISHFAESLKNIWSRKVLVGVFYGYYFACGDVFKRLLETQELFDDKNIDYLAAPNPYTANKKGGNTAFLRYFAESMRLNGKLFFSEIDQGYKAYCRYRNEKNDNKYICADDAEYVAITARNVFDSVLRGMGAWFFDHQHPEDYQRLEEKTGYWDTPARMNGIRRIHEATKRMMALRPVFQSSADVLIVYDTQSIYHFGPSLTGDLSDVHNTYNQFDMADAIAKSGAAYDTIFLSDLQKCNINQYKCVVFVACAAMSQSDFSYIQSTVKGGNRTIVFMRENGYIVSEKTSKENMQKLYETNELDKYVEQTRENYKIVALPQFMYDINFYRTLFAGAGAHIYADKGEVIVSANGFVMVHTKGIEKTLLHLACGDIILENGTCNTMIYDNQSGERIF